MKRFGVIGHPIAHSLSPLLHNAAFSMLGLECKYEAFDVDPSSLLSALRDFNARGFAGLNATIPFKESLLGLVDQLSDEARAVGAVNTVLFREGHLRGENTDVYGISASLERYRGDIEGRPVLLLGAGGSARATMYALISRFSPAEIVIANRDEQRARDLAAHFKPHAKQTRMMATSLSDDTIRKSIERARLIINATSVGMSPSVDAAPVSDETTFQPDQIVLDLVYTPLDTKFLRLASRSGARTIRGLEMFLHQGARSFELWLGCKMPIERLRPVIAQELQTKQTPG